MARQLKKSGLINFFNAYIPDRRDPRYVTYPSDQLLRLRTLLLCCGYEDANDVEHLEDDPALVALCDGALPSQPTISHQVMIDQGGFRSMMASVGQSDSWLITANITSTIPRKIPLRPFLNVGAGKFPAYNPNKKEIKDINLVAELGISIVALPEILEIHIPFVTTNNIKYNQENVLGYDKFWQKITFTFDLRKVNLMEQLDKMF